MSSTIPVLGARSDKSLEPVRAPLGTVLDVNRLKPCTGGQTGSLTSGHLHVHEKTLGANSSGRVSKTLPLSQVARKAPNKSHHQW